MMILTFKNTIPCVCSLKRRLVTNFRFYNVTFIIYIPILIGPGARLLFWLCRMLKILLLLLIARGTRATTTKGSTSSPDVTSKSSLWIWRESLTSSLWPWWVSFAYVTLVQLLYSFSCISPKQEFICGICWATQTFSKFALKLTSHGIPSS